MNHLIRYTLSLKKTVMAHMKEKETDIELKNNIDILNNLEKYEERTDVFLPSISMYLVLSLKTLRWYNDTLNSEKDSIEKQIILPVNYYKELNKSLYDILMLSEESVSMSDSCITQKLINVDMYYIEQEIKKEYKNELDNYIEKHNDYNFINFLFHLHLLITDGK